MSTTFKPLLGTTNQAITITLNSLTSSATAGRQSTVIDNRTNLFLDVLVAGKIVVPTGGSVANDKTIYIKVFGTADDSNYGDERSVAATQATIGATDAAYSEADPTVSGTPCLILAKTIPVPVAPSSTNGTYTITPFSVANCFGGIMPAQWGVFVRNYSGITLHSAGCSMWYQGQQQTGV